MRREKEESAAACCVGTRDTLIDNHEIRGECPRSLCETPGKRVVTWVLICCNNNSTYFSDILFGWWLHRPKWVRWNLIKHNEKRETDNKYYRGMDINYWLVEAIFVASCQYRKYLSNCNFAKITDLIFILK